MSPIAKLFLAGGGVGFTYYLFMRQYWFPNPYKTRAVQNIEDRFSSGGATPTHTPGVATKLGSSTDNESRAAGGHKGPDSEHFKNHISDQKPDAGLYPEKFYEQQYNSPKGK
ncbi:hypothetical protein K505DRAFT_322303 [Melanomma pulvis-pyrius CBS 109.77]|uniref:Uncharacterized protein n=1 Tax=Melanomma pulvis-pyrius CBS 109.77 TaxID=1314802 RepID=A0A6A6XN59_9PLEO|nr:hypothetical protein K505DRAFT_322303 [Melanomma pulvis-pyrius CBS 109.77]